MKQMLGLLFIGTLVLLLSSYDSVIEPYWKSRGAEALELIEDGKFREAIEVLFDEELDSPERSSSNAHAAPPADSTATSGAIGPSGR